MKINEAIQKIEEHSSLIGKRIKGKRATNLVICPKYRSLLGQIVEKIIRDADYHHLIDENEEVEVLVIYGLYNYSSIGYMTWDTLENTIKE